MSILLVIGAIAAIIYYIIQMRAARIADEELNDKDIVRDMFNPPKDEHLRNKYLETDPYDDLEKLASFYERGILTKEEFEAKKKELLDRIWRK